MRRIIVACALAGILGGPAFSQGVDPLIGTWKLNLAKSKFDGPAPATLLTFEAVGQALKVTAESVDAQEAIQRGLLLVHIFMMVGLIPHLVRLLGMRLPYKMINKSTAEITRTKAGKVVLTETRVLSADGRTLTFTIAGHSDIQVYEKQ